MELTGDRLIAATRARVWAALNDPAVLARCIDGGESLSATTAADGATRLDGTLDAQVGPGRATFAGSVTLTEVDPPNRYVLVGEGTGGAGFVTGRAEVTLTDAATGGGAGTQLRYVVTSSGGGRLAGLPVEEAARGYVDTFLARLTAEVEAPAAAPPATSTGSPAVTPVIPIADRIAPPGTGADTLQLHGQRRATGLTPLVWAAVVVLVVLAVLVWQLK